MPTPTPRGPLFAADAELTRPVALALYQAATARYAGLCREIAEVRRRELAAKSQAYMHSNERSASGREDEARYAAAHLTADFFALAGERDAVQAECDFLKRYLYLTADAPLELGDRL
jgi:hypothetical protein